jgi:hypothetical protein
MMVTPTSSEKYPLTWEVTPTTATLFHIRRAVSRWDPPPPGEATVRRVLARIDAEALDRTIGAWLASQQPPPPTHHHRRRPRPWRQGVAVDGKTLRGSGHHQSPPVHLLAAMDHTSRAVLAQTDVDTTSNEITQSSPCWRAWTLPDGCDRRRDAHPTRARRLHPDRQGQPAHPAPPAGGHRNIAAALRRNARDAIRVLPLLGITSPETAPSPPRRGRSGCSSTTTSTHRGSLPPAMTSKLADRVTRVGKWP